MLIAVLSGFLLALLLFFCGKYLKSLHFPFIGLLPLGIFIYLLSFLPLINSGQSVMFHYAWVPSMGINLDFRLDGLALLFGLMITGIGSLVFFYAAAYMKHHPFVDRFFVFLSVFMASMLGLVLADNVWLVFVFWELTSISSFFLIGFNNEEEGSRKSAIMSLSITAGGGFFLLAGFVLLGNLSGSYSIREMVFSSGMLKESSWYGLLIVFLFLGAFTKSAQFPFHFWLPNAMKAPTPVSAYLHSATMVKAGVYLLARFTPVLGTHSYWNNSLMIIGAFTMLYAAIHALFRNDLKAILAYSTIASLGMMFFLLGIGSEKALLAVSVFILVHALYKAGLFLTAGVIDYKTGTRDLHKLSGLRKVMQPVAAGGLLAAISSAGMPLTFGFIGKDLIYEATLDTAGNLAWILTGIAFVSNVCLLIAGLMTGVKPFSGEIPQNFSRLRKVSVLLWVPGILLGVAAIVFGVFPTFLDRNLIAAVAQSINNTVVDIPLKLWHGFSLVILLSILTLSLGFILYFLKRGKPFSQKKLAGFESISPEYLTGRISRTAEKFAFRYTRLLHNGYLRYYLITIIVFLIGLVGYRLFTEVPLSVNYDQLSDIRFYEVVSFVIIISAILITVFTSSRLTAIAGMGIVGYCMCLIFVFYGAPDLAMTQFTIDTLTVVLFVLVLFRLPQFKKYMNFTTQVRDGLIALSFGAIISIIALQAFNQPADKVVSHFYGDNAYVLAKGRNVVNVILVDFRGFDTMVEIIVLSIAALGVYSLLKLKVKAPEKE
ncbi:hydrogen gas-evolving membrane-bound hydrogenase subunit E [Agriterribacter sp.]|uniref:hydrogen gas-evolving membrane-bound hydrogenase subunit E n=1 Tax=Agriterribacter sp. TaxID=2821509 RepID=UPI002C5CE7D3|nr:hydrogen gas-evolving membrane-bound hydrogenase subunit E [Agriterribacter sp.]HRP55016.1 proton-conducting transporter membrane subunit [Agriterribacter sp.]